MAQMKAGMHTGGRDPTDYDVAAADDRVECRKCHHKFASDRIAKHESICCNVKQRKPFDAKKQRLQGELAQYARRAGRDEPRKPVLINGKPKYKVEHENLVKAMRAARQYGAYEKAKEEGRAVGPPPKMPVMDEMPDDRILCKCGRRFGQTQYERHIQSCSACHGGYSPIQRQVPGGRGPPRGMGGRRGR